jgi:hypothetical protein
MKLLYMTIEDLSTTKKKIQSRTKLTVECGMAPLVQCEAKQPRSIGDCQSVAPRKLELVR